MCLPLALSVKYMKEDSLTTFIGVGEVLQERWANDRYLNIKVVLHFHD
jgi:hypothetical protein